MQRLGGLEGIYTPASFINLPSDINHLRLLSYLLILILTLFYKITMKGEKWNRCCALIQELGMAKASV